MSGRDRPAGIPASAHQLWDNGAQSEQVRAGDLWVLSWDGEVVGLAAIAAAKDPAALDKIEEHATSLGIVGVKPVKEALAKRRSELGPSTVDHWATREVPK